MLFTKRGTERHFRHWQYSGSPRGTGRRKGRGSFCRTENTGFQCCLLSNNQYERVSSFNQNIQVHFIENAHKPSRKNYRKAMELMGTSLENTIFVGDQLFTDVYGAKRTGIYNILVKPIHPKEEIQIVLKRKLEKIVLYFYKKEQRKRKNSWKLPGCIIKWSTVEKTQVFQWTK